MFIKSPEVIDPENPIFYYYHSHSHSIIPYQKKENNCLPRPRKKKFFQLSSRRSFIITFILFICFFAYSYKADTSNSYNSPKFFINHHKIKLSGNVVDFSKENKLALEFTLNNKLNKNLPVQIQSLILEFNHEKFSLLKAPLVFTLKKGTTQFFSYFISLGKENIDKNTKMELFINSGKEKKKIRLSLFLK